MTKILTADDSVSIRKMVSTTLANAGYDVIEAVDGQDALTMAQHSPVDLVLTDVNMPKLDGIGLVKALRLLPHYRFTPILLLTTESSAQEKEAARAAGASGWLVKPFNPDQLLATIKKVLS